MTARSTQESSKLSIRGTRHQRLFERRITAAKKTFSNPTALEPISQSSCCRLPPISWTLSRPPSRPLSKPSNHLNRQIRMQTTACFWSRAKTRALTSLIRMESLATVSTRKLPTYRLPKLLIRTKIAPSKTFPMSSPPTRTPVRIRSRTLRGRTRRTIQAQPDCQNSNEFLASMLGCRFFFRRMIKSKIE